MLLFALAAPAVVALRTGNQDHCACLTWRDVYAKHNGTCGSGRELLVPEADAQRKQAEDENWYTPEEFHENFGDNGLAEWWEKNDKDTKYVAKGVDDCYRLFGLMNNNFCVNWNYNSAETPGKQWCYVSSQCTELGDGKTVNDKLSYKTCTSHDTKLVNKGVYELETIARQNMLDLVNLAKWSYVGAGKWNQTSDSNKRMAKESGLMQFYDTENPRGPWHVIEGNATVKSIHFGMRGLTRLGRSEALVKWLSGELEAVKCKEECWNMNWLAR